MIIGVPSIRDNGHLQAEKSLLDNLVYEEKTNQTTVSKRWSNMVVPLSETGAGLRWRVWGRVL